VTKKLKVSETMPQEVSRLEQSSRVPVVRVLLLTSSLPCMQEVAKHLEAIRRAEQWMKVSSRSLPSSQSLAVEYSS
jgi:hypothetical protein